MVLKMYLLSNMAILGLHVSFRGSKWFSRLRLSSASKHLLPIGPGILTTAGGGEDVLKPPIGKFTFGYNIHLDRIRVFHNCARTESFKGLSDYCVVIAYGNIWVFPKIGIPQNGWLKMENLIKLDDLGKPTILGNIHLNRWTGNFYGPTTKCLPNHQLFRIWWFSGIGSSKTMGTPGTPKPTTHFSRDGHD